MNPGVAAPVLDRAGWLARRRIGGSTAAAILGVSYADHTPYSVWRDWWESSGDAEDREDWRWGRLLEPIVAQQYALDTGRQLLDLTEELHAELPGDPVLLGVGQYGLLQHAEHEWLTGSPDAFTRDGSTLRGLEVKVRRYLDPTEWGEPGTDAVPRGYLVQLCVYGLITGLAEWDLVVLVGGTGTQVYRYTRNPRLEELVVEKCGRFWEDHLVAGAPPIPSTVAETSQHLRLVHPRAGPVAREATGEELELLQYFANLDRKVRRNAERLADVRNAVKLAIGHDLGLTGVTAKGWRITATWKDTTKGRRLRLTTIRET